MAYDTSKLTKLLHLKALAERVAQDCATKAEVTVISNKIGTVPTSKTIVGMIDEVNERIDDLPEQTDYTVEVTESTPSGYAKAYTITQEATGLSATINIPKDMVVQSGSVVKNPEDQPAGTYLVLVLANASSDKIYINVSDLIEYVTSGSTANDDVVIAVSSDHKVTATLNSAILAKINKAHEHSNKALLDTYTQTESNLADAVAKKHEHSNGTVLAGITAAKVAAWEQAAADDHTHSNKTELDLIATGDKDKWDAAVTKLAGIADGATKVEASTTNGNIKVNGSQVSVYQLPSDVIQGAIASETEVEEMLDEVFGEEEEEEEE